MKRSMQEVVELVVFALIALLVGTGLVWVSGWLLGLVGTVLTWFAGLVWSLLRFLVPVAIVAGIVYLLVQFLSRSGEKVARGPQEQPPTPPSPWTMSKDGPESASEGTDEASGASETDDAARAATAASAAAAATTAAHSSTADESEADSVGEPADESASSDTADEAGDEDDERHPT